MSTPYAELESSARAWAQKSASLTQEVYRRMLHCSEHLPIQQRLDILQKYVDKLAMSGYSREQIRYILMAGLKAYERRRLTALKERVPIFRNRELLDKDREVRIMKGKAIWFHDKTP